MNCSIIATGTELIIGQTINRNAPEISKKIIKMGFNVRHHLTVTDQANDIFWAIEECSKSTDLIIITGGLGPTSDDLTRNVVAEWCGRELKWDENSWKHVCDRMQSRGFQVKDIQRQQCFFPDGSKIIENSKGTANAFYIEAKNKIFIVLPGPPAEIESVWENGIHQFLTDLAKVKNLDPIEMKVWDTMGLGESDIALKVEKVLHDYLNHKKLNELIKNKFEVGYRVHLPYVEVKLIYHHSIKSEMLQLSKFIDSELNEITKFRDFENVITSLINKIKKSNFKKILIDDRVSHGRFLLKMLQDQFLQEIEIPVTYLQSGTGANSIIQSSAAKATFQQEVQKNEQLIHQQIKQPIQMKDEDLNIILEVEDQQSWLFQVNNRQSKIEFPYKTTNMLERNRQYALEMCLIELNNYLTLNVPSN